MSVNTYQIVNLFLSNVTVIVFKPPPDGGKLQSHSVETCLKRSDVCLVTKINVGNIELPTHSNVSYMVLGLFPLEEVSIG